MVFSKVSRKWLTTIPVEVRSFLGIEEGDILVWDIDESKKVVSVRVLKNPIKIVCGKYSDSNLKYEDIEEKADKLIVEIIYAGNKT